MNNNIIEEKKSNVFDLNSDTPLYKTIFNENGELIYQLDNQGNKIYLSKLGETKPIKHIDLLSDNEYYSIVNGSRLTQAQVEENKIGMSEPIEVYSASEFDNHIMGYIEKETLKKLKPNQPIFKGKSILLNTGGSVGKLRYKNNNYEYTVIDNVMIFYFNKLNKIIQPLFLKSILDIRLQNCIFGFSNTLRGDGVNKLDVKIPIYEDDIMLSMAKLLTDALTSIEQKKETLSSMELLIKNEKEEVLENVICDIRDEKGEKLSKLKDEFLYDTIVNENGEIVLCDKNGNELDKNGLNKEGVDCRVKLCVVEDVEFEEKYIYTSKDWIKDFNKLLKDNKKISNSKDLIDLLNIDKKYCCIQRMGETPSNEEDKLIGINNQQIAWFNIASLQLYKSNIIKNTKKVEDSILKSKVENIKSIKNIPITKNDIMVSFKLTVGVSKLYLSNDYAVCNEAIDILTPCYDISSHYLNYIIGDLYLKNVGNNSLQGGTLNDDIKKSIPIQFPKPYIDKETKEIISSDELQRSISFYIQQKFDRIEEKLETIDGVSLLYNLEKEETLQEVLKG